MEGDIDDLRSYDKTFDEFISIMRFTNGGITWGDLWDMPEDRYGSIVKAVNAAIRKEDQRQRTKKKKI